MQEQYEKAREELKNKEVTGSSGNGLVTLVLDGEKGLKGIKIKPECIDPKDVEGLQDLIVAAHADAVAQLAKNDGDMGDLLNLPF